MSTSLQAGVSGPRQVSRGRWRWSAALAAGLMLCWFTSPAFSATFAFTYAGPSGLSGSAIISGDQTASGVYNITSGTDTVTGGTSLIGIFSIVANPAFPLPVGTGRFVYDDALDLNSPTFLDFDGLLFRNASGDINLYTIGSTYMSGTSTTPASSDQVITVSSLTSVPEPASLAVLALPMGLAGLVVMRRRQNAGAA